MHRLAIREGWTTVILTVLLVFVAVASIQQADWADGLSILNWVMLAGLVTGFIVSKWRRIPSMALHLGGFVVGVVVILFAMTTYLDDAIGNRRDKLRWLWDRGEQWMEQIIHGQSAEDLYLFVLFITIMTFAMAYLTMWFVLRARWIWVALFFPGIVLLLNLGYSLRVPVGLAFVFLLLAILLLMRFTLLQRELTWRRVRIDYPSTLMWRGLWVASYLGIAVLIFGWAIPVDARSQQVHDMWLDVDGPWRTVERQFTQWFTGLRGPGQSGVGGFASFSDNFDLGGPLSLSQDPVVRVDSPGDAPYLAAHRYNTYNGRGWESDVNEVFPENNAISPQIELDAGEMLPLDPRFNEERERQEFTMEVERPRGSLVFSPGSFATADVGTNLVVSWRRVDETVDVRETDLQSLPQEIVPLVEMLREADFTPPVTPTPTASPEATEQAEGSGIPTAGVAQPTATATPESVQLPPVPPGIQEERARLRDERGVTTSFAINPSSYEVSTLNYSGLFPVFHDVEAVRARSGLSEDSVYSVESMVSEATNAQLREAGQSYPEEVTDRYLQLPGTVTGRTQDLARDITADAGNPYDAAKLIETYLRENIAYNENIEFPPADRDVVDYVLFTNPQGYCEYYASAFVVMARSIGIPTRMVTGFFPTDDNDNGEFVYRESNAHAWPEVYFPDYGWVGFEPTAARETISRTPDGGASGSTGSGDPQLPGEGLSQAELGDLEQQQLLEENLNVPPGTGTLADQDQGVSVTSLMIRIVPLLALLTALVVVYLWMRGMRGLSPTTQMYAKVARGAGWGGVRSEPSMTPHEYAEQVGTEVPGARRPVRYLADIYVQETYSERGTTQSETLRARQAWRQVRGLLLRRFFARLRPWKSRRPDQSDDEDW